MSLKGPIIAIEDDTDDQFLLKTAISELGIPNRLVFFENGLEALLYLETTQEQPFLILCDINMPVMNGLELRERIDANAYLKKKAIPFVFLSTADNPQIVDAAYNSTIQGFYKKLSNFASYKGQVKIIIDYWQHCLHPNTR
ncbi:response regulator [Dyadobacter psychrotolerans]|uniref:Response regulator n=1 Tax=Dyadobacter psychrotolerans TaxID=2541721 RepID=A0A4R5DES8_9BACT|nr:response regulator [Dyadobacter psychrotolerans]TDE10254.1 response regulator [Dyadobacter psychrotolerans]